MSWNKGISIVVILLAIVLIGNFFFKDENTSVNPDYQNLTNKIDSLNVELNLLKLQRDSLLNVIDSSKAKVEVIENWYEKELVDITNQPIAADVEFFSNYLKQNNYNMSRPKITNE